MGPPEIPPAAALFQLVTGRWVSAALSVAAKLGVADELAAGPRTAEDVAAAVEAHPGALRRILRALASVGVFAEDGEGRFANTALSEMIRSGPGSMRAMAIMAGERPMSLAWGELFHAVRTGESAFEKAHQSQIFDYFGRDPDFGRVFDEAMTSRSAMEAGAVTAAVDFAGVTTLVDVAGGQGLLLASILAKHPALRGVLFDMPAVVAGAASVLERAGVTARCEVVAGDFFDRVPAGADGYLMKHILHDWDDADCLRILKNIHAAGAPGARLFIVDAVIAPGNAPSAAKLLDLQMLVSTHGGRERTRPEWEQLLGAGGFSIARVAESPVVAVLEARRA